MTTIARPNQAIEGNKVSGSSRRPLISRGLHQLAGATCTRFVASFNVKAKIDEPVEGAPELHPGACTDLDAEVRCDKAMIHTVAKRHSSKVGAESGTHQANQWAFPARTSVTVETAHHEIIDAINKRVLDGR